MRHFFVVVVVLLFSSTAFASGFAVKDQGTKAMSLGNAFTGVADDTTAAWYSNSCLELPSCPSSFVGYPLDTHI